MLPPYVGARASVQGAKKYDWLQESSHFESSMQESQATSMGQTSRVENTRKILAETDKFITSELHARGCNDATLPSVARLQVFDEAMDKFCARCPAYRTFLDAYRREQAELRRAYTQRISEIPRLRAHAEAAQTKANGIMESQRDAAVAEAADLRREVARLKSVADRAVVSLAALSEDLETHKRSHRRATDESDELKRSSTVLTLSLARLEEDRERWALQDNSSRSEALNLRSALDKSNVEMERLKNLAADLEDHLKTERSEAARECEQRVFELRRELAATTTAHRALAIKFRALSAKTKEDDDGESHAPGDAETDAPEAPAPAATADPSPPAEPQPPPAEAADGASPKAASPKAAPALPAIDGAASAPDDDGAANAPSVRFAAPPPGRAPPAGRRPSAPVSDAPAEAANDQAPDVNVLAEPYAPPGHYFDGLGLDDDVPPYLRFEGRVKNWTISKRETERMINDVWIAKETSARDAAGAAAARPASASGRNGSEQLASFLPVYLLQRFKSHSLAIEWGYNLLDGLRRYISDSDCRLFLEIMRGELAEEVRFDQLQMLVEVSATMQTEDCAASHDGRASGALTVPAFMAALRRLLTTKPEHSFARLQRQLHVEAQQNKARIVNYKELLESDAQGTQSKFCELLREQHLAEILLFTQELAEAIRGPDEDAAGDAVPPAKLPLARFRAAISAVDADKPRGEVNAYLVRGADCDAKDLLDFEVQNKAYDVEVFIKKLSQSGLVKKSPLKGAGLSPGKPGNPT
ncbi:hypothetical protein M885DRAFT_513043 [Pelagophyceae sp. CCMP2097]|nr:hypothetical protein M885DRAFT_513043 [Pelagophyceae sp. CCMP2097]